MVRGLKNLEDQARKILDCCEWRIKRDSGEDSGEELQGTYQRLIEGCDQNIGRNMNGNGHSYEVSDGNEEEGDGN